MIALLGVAALQLLVFGSVVYVSRQLRARNSVDREILERQDATAGALEELEAWNRAHAEQHQERT